MKKNAFTLAEVLIALTIIGVIAAITVPALIQRTNKQEYVSALQKAYSTLSQVTNQIIAEKGSPKSSCADCNDGWAYSQENIYNLYKTKLNVLKDCGTAAGCFHFKSIKGLNNKIVGGWCDQETGNRKMILTDGMMLLFRNVYPECNGASSNPEEEQPCAAIAVDINGIKKPNIWGRDVFLLYITENGLKAPLITDRKTCLENDSIYGQAGLACARKVLTEGAMNY